MILYTKIIIDIIILKFSLLKELLVFENANNLEKEKVRLYWRYDISVEIIRCVYYVIKFFLISDRSNISPINKTYESKLHQINSNISYIFTISCRAARERDERALDTSLQIFRSESHVPPIYRPYVYSTMCGYRFTDCDIRSEFIKVRERTNF